MVARKAHNLEVTGSNPVSAPFLIKIGIHFFILKKIYWNILFNTEVTADSGNWTRVFSLAKRNYTIQLYPHFSFYCTLYFIYHINSICTVQSCVWYLVGVINKSRNLYNIDRIDYGISIACNPRKPTDKVDSIFDLGDWWLTHSMTLALDIQKNRYCTLGSGEFHNRRLLACQPSFSFQDLSEKK